VVGLESNAKPPSLWLCKAASIIITVPLALSFRWVYVAFFLCPYVPEEGTLLPKQQTRGAIQVHKHFILFL